MSVESKTVSMILVAVGVVAVAATLVVIIASRDQDEREAHALQAADEQPAPAPEPAKPLQSVAEPAAQPPPAPAPEAPTVEVTATKLFADYDANEVSADDKYRGKAVMVTGIVRRISKNLDDDAVVELATPSEYNSVDATLADAKQGAALKKGQKVVARCRGVGKATLSVVVDKCSIEHVYEWVPK